jgi:hypothetical protein
MSLSVKTLMAAALALGCAMVLQPEPASAQQGYHLYRNGVRVTGPAYAPSRQGFRAGYGGFRGGYNRAYYGRGYGYRPGFYGPRYGYRPAYYGGYYPYRSYRRGFNGGAVAAGLIGGLALGAIASAATNPYYYSPAYYTPARTCYVERRRVVNRYGRVGIRRVQTCY